MQETQNMKLEETRTLFETTKGTAAGGSRENLAIGGSESRTNCRPRTQDTATAQRGRGPKHNPVFEPISAASGSLFRGFRHGLQRTFCRSR